jgi:hypothetical protein
LPDVVRALEKLNDLALPYRVDAAPGQHGLVVVDVRWRVEEVFWRTLLGLGSASKTWMMRVKLSPDGRYRFSESQGTVSFEAGPTQLSAAKSRSWGKTFGVLNATGVWTPSGQVASAAADPGSGLASNPSGPSGPDQAADAAADPTAVAAVRPSDAKIPVFRILRAYGWRPPHDTWLSRIWEY